MRRIHIRKYEALYFPGISAIVRAIDYDGTQNDYFVSKLELMGNIMNIICSPMTELDLVAGSRVMVKNINGNKYDNNWMLRIYAAYGRVINVDYLGECDLENIDWENITMFDYADHIISLSGFNFDKLDEIVGSEKDFGFLGAGWKVNKTITS